MRAEVLVGLAPALLLLISLACGHYPGERLLEAITRPRPRTPWTETSAPRTRAPLLRSSPRGGTLLAMALAGRGPPARFAPPHDRAAQPRTI